MTKVANNNYFCTMKTKGRRDQQDLLFGLWFHHFHYETHEC